MTKVAEKAQALRAALNAEVAKRIAYEESKSATSAILKIVKYFKLDAENNTTFSDDFFTALAKANVATDFSFINNHVKENARFNIYAIEKAVKMLKAIATQSYAACDKYTRAALTHTLRNLDKEDFSFTAHDAKRLALDLNVASSTANTQISSSFRMLEALDILRFDETERDRAKVSDVNKKSAAIKLAQSAL